MVALNVWSPAVIVSAVSPVVPVEADGVDVVEDCDGAAGPAGSAGAWASGELEQALRARTAVREARVFFMLIVLRGLLM
jgi:hypothetical protein